MYNSVPQWGPLTWIFFHTLSEKIREDTFEYEKKNIIKVVNLICNNLPCPYCKTHAVQYLKENQISLVKSKYDLQLYFFQFHNTVNIQQYKQLFVVNDLIIYKTKRLNIISKYFLKRFTENQNNKLMHEQMARKSISKIIIQWLNTHYRSFYK